MSTRKFLQDPEVQRTLEILAEDEYGWRGHYIVSIIDGGKECANWQSTPPDLLEHKFHNHMGVTTRIIRSERGKVFACKPASSPAASNAATEESPKDICDGVIAWFESEEFVPVLITAMRIRDRLLEHNLTENCGLKWDEQIHPRIGIATRLPDAFRLLEFARRGDILCTNEDWSELDDSTKQLLRVAGVKPGPASIIEVQARELANELVRLPATVMSKT